MAKPSNLVKSKRKLLVICGPTATGKTSLALHLSKLFNGEIISADSRQVYKSMDIGTGKDKPQNFTIQASDLKFGKNRISYYTDGNVRLWGYDLTDLKEEFSVSHYTKIANKIIKDILKRKKLPVLVGGTGLYIKGVVDGIETSGVARNNALRNSLDKKEAVELFEILSGVDPIKSASMNLSDRKNPRRLIRAIEVAESKGADLKTATARNNRENFEVLFIGLTAPREIINVKIKIRVRERLEMGLEKEIRELLKKGVNWDMQSMNTLSYKEWVGYFEGKKEKKEVIDQWLIDEKNYAKRQMTWFKKDKRIKWFDITRRGFKEAVENTVEKWHNT